MVLDKKDFFVERYMGYMREHRLLSGFRKDLALDPLKTFEQYVKNNYEWLNEEWLRLD